MASLFVLYLATTQNLTSTLQRLSLSGRKRTSGIPLPSIQREFPPWISPTFPHLLSDDEGAIQGTHKLCTSTLGAAALGSVPHGTVRQVTDISLTHSPPGRLDIFHHQLIGIRIHSVHCLCNVISNPGFLLAQALRHVWTTHSSDLSHMFTWYSHDQQWVLFCWQNRKVNF